jgi:hypothetical protein
MKNKHIMLDGKYQGKIQNKSIGTEGEVKDQIRRECQERFVCKANKE